MTDKFAINTNVQSLAKNLGDSLITRLTDYVKDAADTEFLKDVALEIANLEYQAATAATDKDKERAREDIEFMRARIDTFVARNAIKFHSATQETVKEIFKTVIEVAGAFAGAALKGAIGGV